MLYKIMFLNRFDEISLHNTIKEIIFHSRKPQETRTKCQAIIQHRTPN